MSAMQLQYQIEADAAQIAVSAIDPLLVSTLAGGGHARLQVYTAAGAEDMVATSYSAPWITVVRAENARTWPAMAFVAVSELSPLPLPKDYESELNALVARIQAGPSLQRTVAGDVVTFELPETGVVAGSYGGLELDEYGRVVSIPANWPFNVLIPQAAAASPAQIYANDVRYVPQPSAPIATGTTVQRAIIHLEDAIVALQNDVLTDTVDSVTGVVGNPVVVGGTPTHPVVSLQPSGIAPNTYGGFTVDEYGRITAYTPAPTVGAVSVAATAPLTATFNALTNTYTVAAPNASTSTFGLVKETDVAQIALGLAVPDQTSFPDFGSVVAAINMKIYGNVLGTGSPIIVPSSTPTASAVITTNAGAPVVTQGVNVSAVATGGVGIYTLTFTGVSTSNYHVSVAPSSPLLYGITRLSNTQFRVTFLDAAGAAADPTTFTFGLAQI